MDRRITRVEGFRTHWAGSKSTEVTGCFMRAPAKNVTGKACEREGQEDWGGDEEYREMVGGGWKAQPLSGGESGGGVWWRGWTGDVGCQR